VKRGGIKREDVIDRERRRRDDDKRGSVRIAGEKSRRVFPVRRQTVAAERLNDRRRAGNVRIVVLGAGEGRNPMPMQDRDVGRSTRAGVPVQKVIVQRAGLARPVVMADVVIIRARQRNSRHGEDQDRDPQITRRASSMSSPRRHPLLTTLNDFESRSVFLVPSIVDPVHPDVKPSLCPRDPSSAE
jgi:hypothetical protein